MPVSVSHDHYVCVDCMFAFANGDYPDDEERAKAITDGEERELPARWSLDLEGRGEARSEDEDASFSWRPCACCRSTLGGSRYRCALITQIEETEAP